MPRAKKIINLLIFLPLGIILVIFCVANRHVTRLAFNPFNPGDNSLALNLPLFVLVFVVLIAGILIGSAATWVSQGQYRKRVRQEAKEAVHWQAEADRQKTRADNIAQLPAS